MFDPAQGYPRVVPYVRYLDPAAAVLWLAEVLGAAEALRMTLPDGRIGHAELTIGNAVIALGLALERPPDVGGPVTRSTLRTMVLVFVDDVDQAVERATRYGGSVIDAPADQRWGLRQAIISDPEGYLWEPSSHQRDVAPEAWGASQLGALPVREQHR
jgi:PhnB protein